MTHKQWLKTLVIASGLFGVVSSTNAGTPPAALQGRWAGDRLQLVVDAQGGRVESDCASGNFAGPVTASADGKFSAQGTFEIHQPGPQRDNAAGTAPARYTGELQGNVLKLTITPTGAAEAQVYTLHSGARIKLLRCL